MTSWVQSFRVYLQPKMLAMLLLGFSAGLPLLLVFGTLSFWLAKEGIDRTTIGFISWVALFYGFKFVWAPIVDRAKIPLITLWLGQRRSWMLLAQFGVLIGLISLGTVSPSEQLSIAVMLAMLVAFSSATQDISLDAWRIESAPDEQQGAMAATYQLGYRLGMLLAGGGAFLIAGYSSWNTAYTAMGICMMVGVLTTLLISEPERKISNETWRQEDAVISYLNKFPNSKFRDLTAWFIGAVICPFTEFFKRNGHFGVVLLIFISTFKLSEITLGVMANPFYYDMGFSEEQVGQVTKFFGIAVTIVGALFGGVLVMRFGILRMLVVSGILIVLTNLIFAWLAKQEPLTINLILVIIADNLAGGIAGTVFIAYLSSLTNRAYTATQYALLSSIMLLPAKFIGGFSGLFVDSFGYVNFFYYSSILGIPAILLALYLGYRQRKAILANQS